MANTFFGLTIGTSGIYAANIGINTTGHNIANAETEGFSRQKVHAQAAVPLKAGASYGMQGSGVDVTSIKHERSEYYDRKFWKNSAIHGQYDSKDYYMKSLETYFNEVQLEGFTTTFNKMYDSFQELSKNPADMAVRMEVLNFAQSSCDYFNNLSNSLQSLQEDANFEVKNQVESVNSLSRQIAALTKQVAGIEASGTYANDLRDQRAVLVDRLSGIVDISVSERKIGNGVYAYVVKAGEDTLVDTFSFNELSVEARKEKVSQSDVEGLYEVVWKNGNRFNTLHSGGRLQALFEVRDGNNKDAFSGTTIASVGDTTITVTDTNMNSPAILAIPVEGIITVGTREYVYKGFQVTEDEDGKYEYEFELGEELVFDADEVSVTVGKNIDYKGIPYYMTQMNEFVRTYAKNFNDIHKKGEDFNGEPALDFFNGKHAVTGENYVFQRSQDDEDNDILFTSKTGSYAVEEEEANYGSYYFMTAGNYNVTKAVYTEPEKIATAYPEIEGVEQNELFMDIIALKTDTTMFKQGTPSGFLETIIAELGIDSKKTALFTENQQDIVAAITNQRLSVSGVDTEEESMNLIRYRHAYNLSSKVISTMNETYDRLINYMGV